MDERNVPFGKSYNRWQEETITMAKIQPFNSKNEPHYHDNDKCGAGAEIPAYDRLNGTGNKAKCKNCQKLDGEI